MGTGREQGDVNRRRRRTGRRRRLDAATARSQLLAAGLDLVAERSFGDTLAHLRVNDVARANSLTSGAFYHYWSDQGAYRDDVLDALLAGPRPDADPELFVPPPGGQAGPLDRLRGGVAAAAGRLATDPDHRRELALWAHQEPRAVVPRLLRARHTDAVWATAIGRFLATTGRRCRPGWDLGRLATAAVTLADGLRTQALIDPSILAGRTDGSGRPWSLAEILAVLLLVGATEPGEPDPVPPPPRIEAHPGDDLPRRRRLVELGMEAVRRQPTGNALDHIRAEDVARRLDLTIGAFYHYWESQDDYRDDLLDALLAADRYRDPTEVADQARAVASAPTFDEGIARATGWYWSVTGSHPANPVQIGFHALDDPYIASRLAEETRALRSPWATVLDALLTRFDRRLRAPLDHEVVVLGMSAALDGLIVRHGLDPCGLGPDDEGWTPWGRTCQALIAAASAPVDDDRDLAETARDAFGG